jgi:alpha-1,3-glucosyltransferase
VHVGVVDFDVHRNWLAVTFSLPRQCWYVDRTSQWTLDYPPLFAYFEALLAQVAHSCHLDGDLLNVQAEPLQTPKGILFQRLSVVATDVLLVYGVHRLVNALFDEKSRHAAKIAAGSLVLTNAGLFIVDHIHFQYNGWLLGLLALACALAAERRFFWSAVAFAALVHSKHLFITLGPAVATFVLHQYVFANGSTMSTWLLVGQVLRRLLVLVAAVAGVAALSFAPFVVAGGCVPGDSSGILDPVRSIFARLFPFGERGLMHAYWAPNAWALYSAADLVWSRVTGRRVSGAHTSGLVELGAQQMQMLPEVRPIHCALLTALGMIPVLLRLVDNLRQAQSARKRARALLLAVAHASLTAYWFGWHVHEKAILVSLVPLLLAASVSPSLAPSAQLLHATGGVSLLPLLAPGGVGLMCTGALLLVSQHALAVRTFSTLVAARGSFFWHSYAWIALIGVPVCLISGHSLLSVVRRWPFVPLLLTSVYCAVGIGYVWTRLYFVRIPVDVRNTDD